mmetsp:Transcript_24324/g.78122  ORF Transcript_24324/g.78122 Transcript_24324/m.78122 type:complete len:351 (+) Transcript_24324:3-1055(+)
MANISRRAGLALVALLLLASSASASLSHHERHAMRAAHHTIARFRFAGEAGGEAAASAGTEASGSEAEEPTSDNSVGVAMDEEKKLSPRPEKPERGHMFVIFTVDVVGAQTAAALEHLPEYKAAVAAVLDPSYGVTGNDVEVEKLQQLGNVAGDSGLSSPPPATFGDGEEANNDAVEDEKEAAAEAEAEKAEEEVEKAEEKAESKAETALLEVGSDPLPPKVQFAFRVNVVDTFAEDVVEDLRISVDAGELTTALQSEGLSVEGVVLVHHPSIVTRLSAQQAKDEGEDEEEDGEDEDEEGATKSGAAVSSHLTASVAGATTNAATALSTPSMLLPSFTVLLATVGALLFW